MNKIVSILFLLCMYAGSVLAAPTSVNGNPVNRPVGTVQGNELYAPRISEYVNDPRMQFIGYGGSYQYGGGRVSSYMTTFDGKNYRWFEANGAIVYYTVRVRLDVPINNVTYYHPEKRQWLQGTLYSYTLCLTSRGQVAIPGDGMPQTQCKWSQFKPS